MHGYGAYLYAVKQKYCAGDVIMSKTEEFMAKLGLEGGRGTVVPAAEFDAAADAAALRDAMKGFGTEEQALIDITAGRSNKQRQEIKAAFKQLYGRDLLDDLKSETSYNFRKLLEALYAPSEHYDAICLYEAVKGRTTRNPVVTEILTSRTNEEMIEMRKGFKKLYGLKTSDFINADTSGFYRNLLLALNNAKRDDSSTVDKEMATEDARKLLGVGKGKAGVAEDIFIVIFCLRNYSQLRETFEVYKKLAGRDILKLIDAEFKGELRNALKSVVEVILYRPAYFARRFRDALRGVGTDDSGLIQLVVSRSEVDMLDVKHAFQYLFNEDLSGWILSDTSGDYRKLLLAIVGQ